MRGIREGLADAGCGGVGKKPSESLRGEVIPEKVMEWAVKAPLEQHIGWAACRTGTKGTLSPCPGLAS